MLVLEFDGRDVAGAAVQPGGVDQPTQSKVASSRSSMPRQGPPGWVHSVLYRPIAVFPGLAGQGAIPDGPDRGQRAGVGQPGGVADRCAPAARDAVMHEVAGGLPGAGRGPQRHLQRVQRQPRRHTGRGAPADDARENTSVTNAVNAIPDQVGTPPGAQLQSVSCQSSPVPGPSGAGMRGLAFRLRRPPSLP